MSRPGLILFLAVNIIAFLFMGIDKWKAGQGGKLFGAVTGKEISDALKAQYGLEINKSQLVLAAPIKSFGSYEVKCKLGSEVSGTVYVLVAEAK